MTETSGPLRVYLETFRLGLAGLRADERDELVREIESHAAEATAAGEPLATVLEKLGPADRLARAYGAELLLERRTGPRRFFAVLGVIEVG